MTIDRRRAIARRTFDIRWLLLAPIAAVLVFGLVMANRQLAQVIEFGSSFRLGFLAARTLWLNDQSPYDSTAMAESLAAAGESFLDSSSGDPLPQYAEPIWAALPFGGLLLIQNQWVPVVWLTLSQVLQPVLVLLALGCIGWRPPPLLLAGLLVLSVVWFYGLQPMLLGSPATLALAGVLVLFGALRRDQWWLVVIGTLLAAMDLRLAALPLAIAWFGSLIRRQIVSAIMLPLTVVALMLVSWAIEPGWLIEWARALVAITRAGAAPALVAALPGLPLVVGVTLALMALLLWQWVAIEGEAGRAFAWLAALTLATTYLIVARSAVASAGLLLPAALLSVRTWDEHGGSLGMVLAVGQGVLLVVVPWLVFLSQGEGAIGTPAILLWLPWLATYPALWWVRWWAIRTQAFGRDNVGGLIG